MNMDEIRALTQKARERQEATVQVPRPRFVRRVEPPKAVLPKRVGRVEPPKAVLPKRVERRVYTGLDGDKYVGSLPEKEGGADVQRSQDYWHDRIQAQQER